jgi:hypothetical protein
MVEAQLIISTLFSKVIRASWADQRIALGGRSRLLPPRSTRDAYRLVATLVFVDGGSVLKKMFRHPTLASRWSCLCGGGGGVHFTKGDVIDVDEPS